MKLSLLMFSYFSIMASGKFQMLSDFCLGSHKPDLLPPKKTGCDYPWDVKQHRLGMWSMLGKCLLSASWRCWSLIFHFFLYRPTLQALLYHWHIKNFYNKGGELYNKQYCESYTQLNKCTKMSSPWASSYILSAK